MKTDHEPSQGEFGQVRAKWKDPGRGQWPESFRSSLPPFASRVKRPPWADYITFCGLLRSDDEKLGSVLSAHRATVRAADRRRAWKLLRRQRRAPRPSQGLVWSRAWAFSKSIAGKRQVQNGLSKIGITSVSRGLMSVSPFAGLQIRSKASAKAAAPPPTMPWRRPRPHGGAIAEVCSARPCERGVHTTLCTPARTSSLPVL